MTDTAVRPGQVWRDTDGNRIQAHGGSILYAQGTYYWYGENKEKTTGEDAIWHWGIRLYSSRDLVNWKSEGIIIPPRPDDPDSPLYPSKYVDRPHILYNDRTGKFVCWLKLMGDAQLPAHFAVLAADDIHGPYTVVMPVLNPHGNEVGDFDLVKDPDGRAYVVSERPHDCVFVADLTEDYTDVLCNRLGKDETDDGRVLYSEHLRRQGPPESREAPACFVRDGKCCVITSGTTGYFPNPSETAVAEGPLRWHGEWKVCGSTHPEDPSGTSFCSQVSSVFHVPGTDLYIALADRWRPDVPALAGEEYRTGGFEKRIQEKFRRIFDPDTPFVFTPEDAKDMAINSSVSDYVWLPIRFDREYPQISWLDAWTPQGVSGEEEKPAAGPGESR